MLVATLLIALPLLSQSTVRDEARARVEALETVDRESIAALGSDVYGDDFGAGNIRLAAEVFRLNTERYPDSADVWVDLGRALVRDAADEAEKCFRRALELDTGHVFANTYLSALLRYLGRPDESHRLLDEALSRSLTSEARSELLAAKSALLLAAGDFDGAAELLRERGVIGGGDDGDRSSILKHPYWNEHLIGNIWMAAGRIDEARTVYDAALDDANASGWEPRVLRSIRGDHTFFRVGVAIAEGRLTDARSITDEFRESNPNGYGSRMAEIFMAEGKPELVEAMVTTHSRDGYFARFHRGRAKLALGDTDEGLALLQEVVDWHQVGRWYWLHEYAIVRREALALVQQSE